MVSTNSMKKKIMNVKDLAKTRNKKSMMLQGIKKGNRLAKKRTITKALRVKSLAWVFFVGTHPTWLLVDQKAYVLLILLHVPKVMK
jgi:hypothetical protein